MKLSNEILLTLAYVSRISDPDLLRSRFFESLNTLDEEFKFEFADHLALGIPEDRTFPIATIHSSFGYAVMKEKLEARDDYRAIFRNAFLFLATLLENRMQQRVLESKNESLLEEINIEKSLVRTVLDTLPVGVWIADESGKIMMRNSADEKIWDSNSYIDFIKSNNNRIYKENTEDPIKLKDWGIIRAINTGETVISQEITIESIDGTPKAVLHSAAPLLGKKGKIIGAVGINQDISERKQAEISLENERSFLSAVLENIEDAIVICDEKGRLVRFNEAARKLHGLPEQPIPPDQWAIYYDLYQKDGTTPLLMEDIPLFRAFQGEHVQNDEIVIAPKHDHFYFLVCSGQAITNEKNEIVGAVVAMHDITERKQSEDRIRENEKFLSTLINAIPIPVFYKDEKGRYLGFNKAFETFFGTTRERMIGKTVYDIAPPELADIYHAMDKKLFDSKKLQYYESQVKNVHGELRDVIFNKAVLTDSHGAVSGLVGAILDITDRKKMETQLQQAQKMEAIGVLAGGIAHDFNNILFPIIGYTEMMLEEDLKGIDVRENLDQILTSSLRARDLVQQILAFSCQARKELKPLKIQIIVREVLKLIQASLPSTITIKQNIDKNCGMVLADPTNIHQISMNLITNAFHAMEEDGGTMTITLSEVNLSADDLEDFHLCPGTYVCFSVSDTGHGIEKTVLNRIFEPYFTTKAKGKGTGLGLSVVYGIVKSYNGDIRVFSEPGKGSVFNVYLPRIKSGQEKEIIMDLLSLQGGNEHILLVDDEAVILKMEKQMFESLGYQITTRTSSIEALELFRMSLDKFDLVITDMTMPNMTGEKLAKKLVSIRADIPVIICTGFSEKMDEEKAKEIGVKGLLMKPVVKAELAKMVRKVLDEAPKIISSIIK